MAVTWNWLWLAMAFLTELSALAALGFWGWSVPAPGVVRVLVAVAAPVVAAVLWGLFAAPQAPVSVPVLAVLVKVLVFGGAGLALVATGHPRLALALVVLAALSTVLSTRPVSASVTGSGAG